MTLLYGRPSAAATAVCTMSMHCVEECTRMAPPSSGTASAACGSMYMCCCDGVEKRAPCGCRVGLAWSAAAAGLGHRGALGFSSWH